MKSFVNMACRLIWLGCIGVLGAVAQEPLSLRQAIQQALNQNPEVDLAHASAQEAKAGTALARTQLLPQLNFTEDMSRGNDPVYVFGTKLRQQRFTHGRFRFEYSEPARADRQFRTRLSGSWHGV